jgi:hypothetical protein
MTLHVFVEGRTPYEVKDQWVIRAKGVTLGWGMVLPVKVDPNDPQQVAIDWKALAKQQQAEAEQRRAGLAAMGPVGPDGAPTTGTTQVLDLRDNPELRQQVIDALAAQGITLSREPDPAGGDDDLLSQLERLTALRASGALTESEFRAQKRKLLGKE